MNRTPVGWIVRRSLRRVGIVINACVAAIALAIISIAMTDVARAQKPSPRAPGAARTPRTPPNIVLMFPDNLGWGEVNVYGGVRGAITPRLDRLAAEGLRLNNFNVEFSCVVSRAALMTGRYAIRTGATQASGITLWEVTIAEALQSAGYATALFGKWHLGGNRAELRNPSQQGFDEFYGIPRTSNEAQTTIAQGEKTPNTSFIWEGRKGSPPRNVRPFDLESRRTIDRESAEKSIDFMTRSVRDKRPFFVYYPMTQIHFPTLPHRDFAGKTGAGDIGDAMAELDHNVGLMLDAIDRLGIARNTIVMWCTDNGAEGRRPWRGSAGPWSGFYNSVMEGGIRTPCIIRWPGRIPAGRVSNELVHEIDFFPTIASAIGADIVPRDRAIDGVNQLPFFEGKQPKSNRESVLLYANTQLRAVKWHDWKLHYVYAPDAGGPAIPPLMRLFNLLSDPKEETDVKDANPWVRSVTDRIVNEFTATVERYPHVPPNAQDPYTPPNFAGQWTLEPPKIALTPAVPGTPAAAAAPGDLGSGWGTALTIAQDAARLSIEYPIFSRYDLQPPVKFTYPLDGSLGRNVVTMGRGEQVESSRARWDGQTLVVVTTFQVDARDAGQPLTAELTRKLWLESPTTLIVEATHAGILGGPGSTTRSIYRKE